MKNLITEGYSPRVWSQDKPILIGCSSDMMSWAAKYAESERRTETKLSELPPLSEHPRLYSSLFPRNGHLIALIHNIFRFSKLF